MSSHASLRMRDLVLSVLVPCLLVATCAFGWLTYRELYAIILDGFDAKLMAVSTATASFIDGDDHARILRERTLVGLARDPSRPFLWGLDGGGSLMTVDLTFGGARDVGPVGFDSLAGLTFDSERGRLLTVRPSTGALIAIDTASGRGSVVAQLPIGITGLAVDTDETVLLAAGTAGLLAFDVRDGAPLPSPAPDAPALSSVAVDPESGDIYALEADGLELLHMSVRGGTLDRVGALRPAPADDTIPPDDSTTGEADAPSQPTEALSFGPGGQRLFAASGGLLEVDPASGFVERGEFSAGYRDESGPLYMDYVGPMRRIMAKKDLTYLYTQILEANGHIIYVLDATQGDEHTPIGSEDELPPEEISGTELVLTTGEVHLSAIQQWEIWGLLKSAFAPIRGSDGTITAMAGADVNISIISTKTRIALAKVGVVAILTLLLGGVVSLWISRRLVTPLAAVKEGALRVAAGDFGSRIAEPNLLELQRLTASFNDMSGALRDTMGELQTQTDLVEELRLQHQLESELKRVESVEIDTTKLRAGRLAGSRDREVASDFYTVPGASGGADQLLVWFASPDAAPESPMAVRREMAILTRHLVALGETSWGKLSDAMAPYLKEIGGALMLIDPERRRISSRVPGTLSARIQAMDGRVRTVDLSDTPELELRPEDSFLVASSDLDHVAEQLGLNGDGTHASTEPASAGGQPEIVWVRLDTRGHA